MAFAASEGAVVALSPQVVQPAVLEVEPSTQKSVSPVTTPRESPVRQSAAVVPEHVTQSLSHTVHKPVSVAK
jgi:hypothetical protein